MGFLSNLFKDKKKDQSRNTSAHEQHHVHRDPSQAENRTQESLSQQQDVGPIPRAPSPHKHISSHAEHSKEIPQHPSAELPQPQPADVSQQQDSAQAPKHSRSPLPHQQSHHNQQRRAQKPQRQTSGLQPAYCYTSGKFSETISREEAMLAKQYNFAATEDRAHAEATASSTRRAMTQPNAPSRNNNNAAKNDEFDSIFTQFMHETSDK
ncbi:hypothetical protein ABB37_02779 [Leptomonas pyrrhocoris]|uniref:Uncharacterized protein n=1 Tax=Leptomonas pyrrhocoris TaxID=157538 RepID=A0A0M9G5Z0_LEPPY|nr:hypothetical protein ABB37_02779 [Leptomonas pyrrhocoris]KPA83063.1 hypothetical protein ABB37_02779 [Leptomonas pyrrhocoris]|eukprot:XP_015661502.1 hypothetical protein ABB37_02779 [Leptomonas pyrrhocoris]